MVNEKPVGLGRAGPLGPPNGVGVWLSARVVDLPDDSGFEPVFTPERQNEFSIGICSL
jgi:hypothetical protein